MKNRYEETVEFVWRLMRGAQEASGLGLRDFGKQIGVSAATMCRFNQGKLVDIVTFLKFVDYLKKP